MPPPRCQRKRCHPPIHPPIPPPPHKPTHPPIHPSSPRKVPRTPSLTAVAHALLFPCYKLKRHWQQVAASLDPVGGGWWEQEPLRHAPITLPTPTITTTFTTTTDALGSGIPLPPSSPIPIISTPSIIYAAVVPMTSNISIALLSNESILIQALSSHKALPLPEMLM